MRKIVLLILAILSVSVFGQSKSITNFRSDFKENSNMFFYSSTLKMLNTENNPEFAEILDGIEEIRVLNYTRSEQKFDKDDIARLKADLQKETFNTIMMINEKGNSINVLGRERKGRTVGMVAIIEDAGSLVLIDLIGTIDIKKFMALKQKLTSQTGNKLD
jgi:hypothetical protein